MSAAATNSSRRHFLRGIFAAGVAPVFLPSRLLGSSSATAPSNKVALGFIGVGDHGRAVNLASMLAQPDAQVVALCDVDRKHLGLAAQMVTTSTGAAPPGGALHRDWREVIARPDIDAVVISTPDHWHTPIAMAALRAGKDVLCEKPTLTIHEGQVLVAAVRRYGRIYQASTEDRALPMYHRMAELVRNGAIGRLHTIRVQLPPGNYRKHIPIREDPIPPDLDYEMWLGPAPWAPYQPERVHFNFRWIQDYSGGMLTDWGTHQVDTAQWGNDTELTGPVSVQGMGEFDPGLYDTAWNFDLEYLYRNGVRLKIDNTGTGLRFEGDKGWVGNSAWRRPVEASSAEILDTIVPPPGVHLYTEPGREHRNFLDCVRSRRDPYFPVEKLHRLSSLLHCGNICLKLGRKLAWNPDREEFVNDATANRLRARAMREPWHL